VQICGCADGGDFDVAAVLQLIDGRSSYNQAKSAAVPLERSGTAGDK